VGATSNGIEIVEQFLIVVFAAGAQNGAVTVDGQFIAAPSVAFQLDELDCSVTSSPDASSASDSSCRTTTASPAITTVSAAVIDWGLSTPGSIALTDNCGGTFTGQTALPSVAQAMWQPPVAGGVCILTARAVNGDGGANQARLAVLVRPGVPSVPRIEVSTHSCSFTSDDPMQPVMCPAERLGGMQSVTARVFYHGGPPGSLTMSDSCNGGTFTSPDPSNLGRAWTLPSVLGLTCTVTVTATSLQGVTSVASAQYRLNLL
jgi:hypothetical protein